MRTTVVNIGHCPLDEKCETVTGGYKIFESFCPIYQAAKTYLEGHGYAWDAGIDFHDSDSLRIPPEQMAGKSKMRAFESKWDKEGMALLELSKLKTTHTCCCTTHIGSPEERKEAEDIMNAMKSARKNILEEAGRTEGECMAYVVKNDRREL